MTSVQISGRSFFCPLNKGKTMGTYRELQEALMRARVPKQSSTQAVTLRAGELDQRLGEMLQAEAQLLALKKRVEASLSPASGHGESRCPK
jgi:adhesin HecA-like repeat protein